MLTSFVKRRQQTFSEISCNRYESSRILGQFSENGSNFYKLFIYNLLELLKITVTKRLRLFYSPSACNEVAPAGVSEEQRFRGCWMRIEAAALMPGGWCRAILQIAEHGGGAFVA